MNYTAQGSKQPPLFRIRIPELHAMLPQPKSWEDHTIIGLYPTFSMMSAGDATMGLPVPGELVWIDFKNRTNMSQGYITKPYNGSMYGEVLVTLPEQINEGKTPKTAFMEVCEELPTLPPTGDPLPGANVIIPSREIGQHASAREENIDSGVMRDRVKNPPGPLVQTYAKAHPRTIKLWYDQLQVKNVQGQSWIGKYKNNGSRDTLERNAPGRETIIFVPKEIDVSKPTEIIYYFHDVGGFDQREYSERIIPALKKMSFEKRNFALVYHELMWSKSDIGNDERRSEGNRNAAKIFRRTQVGGNFVNLHTEVMKTINDVFNIKNVAFTSFIAVGKGGQALKNIADEGVFNNLKPKSITMASADFAIKSNYDNDATEFTDPTGFDYAEGDPAVGTKHNHSWTWKVWDALKDDRCEFNLLCVGKKDVAPLEVYSKNKKSDDMFGVHASLSFNQMIRLPGESPHYEPLYSRPDKFSPTANTLRFISDYYKRVPKINSSFVVGNPNGLDEHEIPFRASPNQAITVSYVGLDMTHEQVGDLALFWKNNLHENKSRFAKPIHNSPKAATTKKRNRDVSGGGSGVGMSDKEYKKAKKGLDNYPKSATGVIQLGDLCGRDASGNPEVGKGDYGLADPANKDLVAFQTLIKQTYAMPFKAANYAHATELTGDNSIEKGSRGYVWYTHKYGSRSRKKDETTGAKTGWQLKFGDNRRSGRVESWKVFPYWKETGINNLGPGVTAKDLLPPHANLAALYLKASHHTVQDHMGIFYNLGSLGWDKYGKWGAIDCQGYVNSVRIMTAVLIYGDDGGPLTQLFLRTNGWSAESGNGYYKWLDKMVHAGKRNLWYDKGAKVARANNWFPIAPNGSGASWTFPGTDNHGAKNLKAPQYYMGTPNNVGAMKGGMGTNGWSGRNLMPGDIIRTAKQPFSPACTKWRLKNGKCFMNVEVGTLGHKGFNRPGYADLRSEPSFGHQTIAYANENEGGELWVAESGGPHNGSGHMPYELFKEFRKGMYLYVQQPPEMMDVWNSVRHITGTQYGRPDGEWSKSLYKQILASSTSAVSTFGAPSDASPTFGEGNGVF